MKLRLFPLLAGCVFLAIISIPAQDSPSPAPAAPAAVDLSQYKTAGALWDHLQSLKESGSDISDAAGAEKLFNQILAVAQEFRNRYKKDPRRWDAALIGASAQAGLASVKGGDADEAMLEKTYKEVANAPDASKDARMDARLNLIGSEMQKATASSDNGGNVKLTPALDRMMTSFIHDFPDSPDDADLQRARLKSLEAASPAKADKFLATLLNDPNPAVAKMAESAIRSRDLQKKPFELKFTAADGSPVDVSKLRGKVVLIDYWATWCGPCMEKVPELVAAYKQYHDKGLEIVGVSLDQDQNRMLSVTREQGMTWPQYFDGKGWDNEISSSYGIDSIPRMWLVNRKGMVVDTDAEEGVKDKIGKLIAE
ncbi:MAG TPA: TlpA disulfide reductase family protein [Chthoniobacteraceae bacterium]|jgi:thiol-disulfide isomerase/thioredoxin|nr:TlpA disulfide reductase family protein [Chthoniobacteraceae bacterium]